MKLHKFLVKLSIDILAFFITCLMSSELVPVYAAGNDNVDISSEFLLEGTTDIISKMPSEEETLEPEIVNISVAAGQSIDDQTVTNELYTGAISNNFYKPHDYSIYVSPTLKSRLSANERALYDAYDSVLSTYLNSSNLNATKYSMNGYSYYVTNSVNFSEYGLTEQQAFAVAQLFLYNNPQYYFVPSMFLATSTNIWFTVYDIFASGLTRAVVTNALFAKLDQWIAVCSSVNSTPYMMEYTVHNMLCDHTQYAIGPYDQSIYSVLIQNKTVCAGYAKVMTMMCNAMGIDTITMLSDTHAWNVVKLDNSKYYAVDVTWDDSFGNYCFFDVSNANLKRFDTSLQEHVITSAWPSSWIFSVSMTDYDSHAMIQ